MELINGTPLILRHSAREWS